MKTIITFCIILSNFGLFGQTFGDFNSKNFPLHLIDEQIISKRNLQEKVELLKSCDWANRVGKKIDVFWLKTQNGNLLGYVYEYFLDCDNLRLIYWYLDTDERGKIVDFMIENLEDESQWVVSKKRHLKNRKKYQKFLKKE